MLRSLLQARLEPADAVTVEQAPDLVLDLEAGCRYRFALASRLAHVLVRRSRDRRHAAPSRLTSQPAEKGTQQHVDVDAIGFGPSPAPFDRDAGRMHHIHLDAALTQKSRYPEAVAPRFVAH